MEGLLLLLALAAPLPIILGIALGRRQRARLVDAFQSAANELGLFVERLAPTVVRAAGDIGGFGVVIQTSRFGPDGGPVPSTVWVIDSRARIPLDLVVRKRRTNEAPFRTGDEVFDAAVTVLGKDVTLYSLLTTPIRRALLEATEAGVLIHGGRVEISEAALVESSRTVVARTKQLLALASRITDRPAGPASLIDTLTSEPSLRFAAARTLVLRFSDSEPARRAAEWIQTREDSDQDLRTLCSAFDADRGHGALTAVMVDERRSFEVRAFALHWLVHVGTHEGRVNAISRALEIDTLRNAAIGLVITSSPSGWRHDGLERLVWHAVRVASPDTLSALLLTLTAVATEASEPILIELVGHDDLDVRGPAAEILARVGTHRAIEPLKKSIEGRFAPRELREVIERSIRAIKSRLSERPGALTLSESSAQGAVSLAEDRGSLSKAPAEGPPAEGAAIEADERKPR
ncbi:MAG: hypothetical protein HY791_32920 [Deltaproteobacteria bacterium]|nr:hypothetical protein [Deltaproteobacteria bacterium]